VDNASAADVDALIKHAQTVVQQRFGVSLRTEIRKVGEWCAPRSSSRLGPHCFC
jgi:UDP-N-acetylenolpyruvoylglucosamine reductase